MSPQDRCQLRGLVDDHFAGRIDPTAERRMREHLPGCVACREHYERHLLLAGLDPEARSPEERLARGLGLAAPRPRRTRRWLAAATAAAAAAAVLVLVLLVVQPPGEGSGDSGFQPRGGGEVRQPPVELLVYRLRRGKEPELVKEEGTISRGDELAFAYRNDSDKKRLLVFGVDEHRNVYWFHPAWRDPGQNPTAIAIQFDGKLHELKEAVGHDYRGGRLSIHALFVDRALTVREVETLLGRGGASSIEGALQDTRVLTIQR
jgi:hypothetical protein